MKRMSRERAAEVFGRGVLPVRRPLSSESADIVDELVGRIVSYFPDNATILDRDEWGVSVVSLSRFDPGRHYDYGPATREVAQQVASSGDELDATLGKLMIVGGWPEYRLAVGVKSRGLIAEEGAFCVGFASRGYPLRRTGEAPKFRYNPHATIAELGATRDPFDKDMLRELSNIGGQIGKTILLESAPVCMDQEQEQMVAV